MSFRRQRANHDVRARLASILDLEVRDPRLRGVHVMGVELSPDFTYARVFYRTLDATDEAREAAAQALTRSKGFIRKRLGETISMRRTPELDFRFDDSVDRGGRIDQILREIEDDGEPRAERESEQEDG